MKRVGLYFGTFNPIHIGHLIIANYVVEHSDLEEVWFVITPKSPFKTKNSLLHNNHRYQMVYEAIKEYSKLKASKIEFNLPQPNYTIDTLVHLEEEHENTYKFALIMGSDNLASFHKWKNYQMILERYEIYVYPRMHHKEVSKEVLNHPKIHKVSAPIMEISSTFIRKNHKEGKNVRPMLPDAVWAYMDEMNFYK
jgi:nicotinate-nucleotide adenylyltransferase